MRTYFDAVLDKNYHPIFNGTREETINFLKEFIANDLPTNSLTVIPGETMQQMNVDEYLIKYQQKV